jgi:transcriptional regulator with XRE-family HTH domain
MMIQATPQQRSPLDLRRDLGTRLRTLRVRAGLTGRQLAELLGCHPSKISRLEHGAAIPSIADVRAWCAHTGAEGEADDLAAQAAHVEAAYSTWRSYQRDGLLRLQRAAGDLFTRTRRFHAYESRLVPGLLQTAAYARAILESEQARRGGPDDVDDAVELRFGLRSVLDGTATFAMLFEEHVLRSPIVPPEAMREQGQQLIEDSQRANMSLGIIPTGLQRTRWGAESFYVYDQELVRVQLVPGRFSVNAPGDVAEYLKAFEELSAMAVYGDAARDLIRDATG